MVLLRPRLCCHYCGGRYRVKHSDDDAHRRFKCEHCSAVNFLDENGEIADVPPEEAADPDNLLGVTDSPAGSRFESSIFCQTCVKNQFYFNQNLSEYLPDLDDPEYAKYEAALPEYKRKLEDRYPQVCARCEPKVRQQLQQATYTAKSDHVRRMLAKSREKRIANRLGWRSLVITLGGIGYWTSVAGQLLWHAMGALTSDRISEGEQQPSLCISNLVLSQASPEECTEYFGLVASHALKLGILCLWWNPRWQHKLAGLDGRLTNLDTYYQAQVGIIAFRFASWAGLQYINASLSIPDVPKALHGVSLVLLLVMTAWSNLAIVAIDTTPLVDWTQDIGPLLSEKQYVPPQVPQAQLFTPPNSQPVASQPQQFSIGSLGPAATQHYNAWRPPTPPTEDPDAMDWEPLNSQFTAQSKQPVVKSVQPSPFHGTLPALNPRGVHKAISRQQPAQREAIGIPPGFFDSGRKAVAPLQQNNVRPSFAEPSFFPQQDKGALGLEKIFDDVFKLRDDTALPRTAPPTKSYRTDEVPAMFRTSPLTTPTRAPTPTNQWSASNILSALAIPFLFASLALWLGEDFGMELKPNLKLYMCLFACTISLGHFLLKLASVQHSSKYFVLGRSLAQGIGTMLSAAQVLLIAAMCLYRWRRVVSQDEEESGGGGGGSHGSAGQLDPLLFCAMLWQEFCYFMTTDANSNELRQAPHILATSGIGGAAPSTGQQLQAAGTAMSSSPNPSEASTVHIDQNQPDQQQQQQTGGGFGRPRGNSLDSVASSMDMSVTSATSTVPGWKTPKMDARRAPSVAASASGPSPGFGLGGLRLDDMGFGGGSGVGVAGARERVSGRRRDGRGGGGGGGGGGERRVW